MSAKIQQPKEHKARICLWADLTVNNMDLLEQAVTAHQLRETLSDVLGLRQHMDEERTQVELDLYFYTVQFAREHNFNKEQTSALFTIVKRTHEVCTETPLGNLEQCFSYFRELVLCHAVRRPPFSIDLFNAEEVKLIIDYVVNTYFRHYKLYKYVFTPTVRLDLSISYTGLDEESPSSPDADANDGDDNEGDKVSQDTGCMEQGPPAVIANEVPEQPASPVEEEKTDLKSYIQRELSSQLSHVHATIAEQMKQSEQQLAERLASIEGRNSSGKNSSKSNRK
ncbi:cilia- and flagella-associated protein 119 [Lampetra fluviatilis]